MGQAADVAQREPVMVLPAGGRDAASLAYVVAKRKFGELGIPARHGDLYLTPDDAGAGAALVGREGKLSWAWPAARARDAGRGAGAGQHVRAHRSARPILADLIEKGRRSGPARPWLGLATEELHGHLMVTRVSPEGPADKAGVRNGDIVVGVGADPVKSHEDLYRKVWGLGAAGVEVPLKVLQGVDMRELKLRSIDRFQYFKEKSVY
jgi:S1-C subfamily serine protease